jgi:hypothetical protein
VSSVGLRIKCDCSGKAQKQFNSKLETRFLVREDALKAEQRNCHAKEEQDKIWSRVPKGGPIPRLTYWSTDCRPQDELQLQQEIVERISYFSLYDTGRIEDNASNNSYIVAYILYCGNDLLKPCLATIRRYNRQAD